MLVIRTQNASALPDRDFSCTLRPIQLDGPLIEDFSPSSLALQIEGTAFTAGHFKPCPGSLSAASLPSLGKLLPPEDWGEERVDTSVVLLF